LSALAPAAPVPEFRSYRRFVSLSVLLFVSLGSAYLLVSVGTTIYRRRHAVPTGAQVSEPLGAGEVAGCYDELDDVTRALQKHLENFHHLLGGYDPDVAQRWSEEGSVWRRQWAELGRRCRFSQPRLAAPRKPFEEMVAAYDELGQTQTAFTQALVRYGRDQAPRLDRIRARIQKIGARLSAAPATGEPVP